MDCGGVDASGIAGMHCALVDKVRGRANQDTEISGFEGQDISNRLGLALQGQRCLIWLDNVQEPSLLPACCPANFDGALLVTSNKAEACDLVPAPCFLMKIASNSFWAAAEGSGGRIATKILAARAADNRDTETFPPGCEVGPASQFASQIAPHFIFNNSPFQRNGKLGTHRKGTSKGR